MTSTDNAYTATGNGVREDFLALATDNGHRRPTTGFQTREVSGNNFWFGGSFGGSIQGVYGQSGEDPGSSILQRIFAGVYGASRDFDGVYGWSTNATAVAGTAPQGNGVEGASHTGRGVSGTSDLNAGVEGLSAGDIGVRGFSGLPGPPVPNPVTIAGVWGTSNEQHGVIGTSNARVGVFGYSTNGAGIVGITSNPASLAGAFFGNVGVNGNLQVSGLKAAVVPFPDGSQRALYCMESPEVLFEDFGSAKLARGRAVVKLDANFAKVIKRGDYRVFVTPEGNCHGLYVRRKSANNFEVRELMGGKSSIAFSYRIVGRRKDIKQPRRFAKIDMPLPPPPRPPRAPRKPVPTAAGLRAFIARVEKEARERAPKGAEKVRAEMRRNRGRSPIMPPRAR